MKILVISLLLISQDRIFSQNQLSSNDTSLTGTWKGNSVCQVKNSPCKDEIAVYHISATRKTNTYHIIANKMVNGTETSMGEDDFTFTPANGQLYHKDEERDIVVSLTVKNNNIEGTLVSKGILYRVIKLTRVTDQ